LKRLPESLDFEAETVDFSLPIEPLLIEPFALALDFLH
jgi:hypothetical protein